MDALDLQRTATLALLAALALPTGTQAQTVYYLHTDIQGSVVAVTDENRNVVERRAYEPYGLPRAPIADGPGYTGHDHDGDSELVYAQQRYYDPKVGQFLSVDPVGVDPTGGANFNRYWYGNDNPYKFVDPDGMLACDQDEQPCSDTQKAEERRNERRSKAGPGFVSDYVQVANRPQFSNPTGGQVRGQDGRGNGAYRARRDGGTREHAGIDIEGDAGTIAVAPYSGTMEVLGPDEVRITSPTLDGIQYSTRLLHLNVNSEVGSVLAVSQDQALGTVENLGIKYPGITNHVHLELYIRQFDGNFIRVDPTPYFFP